MLFEKSVLSQSQKFEVIAENEALQHKDIEKRDLALLFLFLDFLFNTLPKVIYVFSAFLDASIDQVTGFFAIFSTFSFFSDILITLLIGHLLQN